MQDSERLRLHVKPTTHHNILQLQALADLRIRRTAAVIASIAAARFLVSQPPHRPSRFRASTFDGIFTRVRVIFAPLSV